MDDFLFGFLLGAFVISSNREREKRYDYDEGELLTNARYDGFCDDCGEDFDDCDCDDCDCDDW